jgi:hypothetical protein
MQDLCFWDASFCLHELNFGWISIWNFLIVIFSQSFFSPTMSSWIGINSDTSQLVCVKLKLCTLRRVTGLSSNSLYIVVQSYMLQDSIFYNTIPPSRPLLTLLAWSLSPQTCCITWPFCLWMSVSCKREKEKGWPPHFALTLDGTCHYHRIRDL